MQEELVKLSVKKETTDENTQSIPKLTSGLKEKETSENNTAQSPPTCTSRNNEKKKYTENGRRTEQTRPESSKTVAWVGTSISKALDKTKFEKDSQVKVKFVKAYSISEETKSSYPKEPLRFPHANFKKIVPEVLEDENIGTLIMQTGSIEITNIQVN